MQNRATQPIPFSILDECKERHTIRYFLIAPPIQLFIHAYIHLFTLGTDNQ